MTYSTRLERTCCFPVMALRAGLLPTKTRQKVETADATQVNPRAKECLILTLPDEILVHLTRDLNARAIASLRSTCRTFRNFFPLKEWLITHVPKIHPILFYKLEDPSWLDWLVMKSELEEGEKGLVRDIQCIFSSTPHADIESALMKLIRHKETPASPDQSSVLKLVKKLQAMAASQKTRNAEAVEHLIV